MAPGSNALVDDHDPVPTGRVAGDREQLLVHDAEVLGEAGWVGRGLPVEVAAVVRAVRRLPLDVDRHGVGRPEAVGVVAGDPRVEEAERGRRHASQLVVEAIGQEALDQDRYDDAGRQQADDQRGEGQERDAEAQRHGRRRQPEGDRRL